MAQPTLKRHYRLSDGNLILTGTRIVQAARRDATEVLAYGITEDIIDAIEAKITGMLGISTDEELAGIMKEATAAKHTKRTEATTYVMKQIMGRVNMEHANTSGTYERFGTKDIHGKTDGEFLICLHRVVRQATALLTPLAGTGLTAPIVAEVENFANDFLELWIAQTAAIDDRDQEVEKRITAGNSLYTDIAKIAELGKTIWQGVSDAKYNDYVMYSGGKPAHDQTLEGTVAPTLIVNVSATGITGTSEITITAVGGSFKVGFAENATDEPVDKVQTITESAPQTYIAKDIGFLAGVRERLNVFNPSATVSVQYVILVEG